MIADTAGPFCYRPRLAEAYLLLLPDDAPCHAERTPAMAHMHGMLLEKAGVPLRPAELSRPEPASGQLLLRVAACGVCRTDLHIADGELAHPKLPLILGHEIVGDVVETGPGVDGVAVGDRVGVPWLGWTCGSCAFCASGRENLCPHARFTGYYLDGGYAQYAVADARFCFPISRDIDAAHAAPLLCAGLIGYRALRLATGESPPADARGAAPIRAPGAVARLGIYGFGAAAHIVAQIARHQGREVFAFTRPDDADAQRFALELGATWAGNADADPPQPLDAALIFAPVGALVPTALRAVRSGGTVVCAGIHMSDIPSFPYSLLWGERVVRSVANLTRRDGEELLALAPAIPVQTHVQRFALDEANDALADLRDGRLRGAAVLIP